MMARLKNNTSKTNRIFFIFSPIVYDFKNVLVLMFLTEIKTVAFRYQCCCAIIQCWNCIASYSGLWNARRYNINYRMSRKKSYAFPMPFADTTWNRIIHTLFLTVVSNLVILIKFYITSSEQRFYTIKIILQDLAWKLE